MVTSVERISPGNPRADAWYRGQTITRLMRKHDHSNPATGYLFCQKCTAASDARTPNTDPRDGGMSWPNGLPASYQKS